MIQLYTGFYSGCNSEGKEKTPNATRVTNGKPFPAVENEANILGVLRPQVVMVDFDTQADAQAFERILACQNIKVPTMTTTKGKHFYFLSTPDVIDRAYTKVPIACGLVADFKLGSKRGLDLIKFHGQMREWVNENEPLRSLPRFMCKIGTNIGAVSLTELTEGSRNDTLFTYVGKLKRAGFSFEESQQLMLLINKAVLPRPLKDSEIKALCRPEAYKGAYEKNKSKESEEFDRTEFANELMAKYSIAFIGGSPFYRENGIYQYMDKYQMDRLILSENGSLSVNQRREISTYCMAMCPRYDSEVVLNQPQLMAFANGVVDVVTREVKPFDTVELPFTSCIPFEFPTSEPAPNETVDAFLDAITCGQADRKQLLLEMVGSCLYRKNILRSIFVLVGDKANGKSTLLKFLTYCLGTNNVTSLSMHELNNQFMVSKLIGKLANLGDDIGDAFISDSSTLKSLATSDRIVANIKFHDPIDFNSYATLIFTSNFLPRVNDPTGAFMSRLKIVRFDADFSHSADIGILERLCQPQCASYMLYMGARSFAYALSQGKFSETADMQPALTEFKESSNPVALFVAEEYEDLNALVNAPAAEVYDRFNRFCIAEGCSSMSRTMFTRRIKGVVRGLGTKKARINGELGTMFVALGPLSTN